MKKDFTIVVTVDMADDLSEPQQYFFEYSVERFVSKRLVGELVMSEMMYNQWKVLGRVSDVQRFSNEETKSE